MAPKSRRHGMPARHTKRVSAISIRPQFEQLESRIAPALFNVQNPMSFSGLNNNGCVVVSDFNKDGFTDAVLTNFGTDHGAGAAGTISVLYGNSSGGFNKIQLNTGGLNVSFASVGDINGDTWPDLVVSNGNQQNTGSVSVFRNDAEGNLIPQGTPFSAGGNNSAWVGLSDMTGDNILDVVVANFGREQAGQIVGNNVTIFQGNTDAQGKGNFAFTLTTTLAPEIQFVPTSLAIADFDADGIKDIAAVSPGIPPDFGQPYPPGTVYVFEGTGSGGYLAPNQFESGGALPVNVQAADLNGDGDQDLVIANAGDPLATPEWNNDGIGVLPNVSSGGTLLFGIPNSLTTNTHGPFAVAVSDFDVDGDQDIAAINYGSQLASPAAFVSVYLRGANGTYAPGSPGSYDTMTSVGGGQYLAVGNFNSDGTPDLIVAHASNLVGVLLNTSVPSISTTTTLQSSLNPSAAAESVTFTATVSASSTVTGGTVTFFDNGIPMGPAVNLTSQQAAFTTTTLTAGTHSITATYSGAAGFAASTSTAFSQVVNPGVAQTFTITGLPSITSAGTAFNVSVSARDQFGNVANGYRGIVHFTSTDAQAVLPSDYTFTAADNGAHTFTITLKTQGAQSLTVTDTVTNTITGTANTTVNAAAASVFTVTGFPTSTTAGVSQNLTVTAMDAFGNVAGGYRGTVHFTSSDPQATLPVDYTFTAADNGVHNFAAALKTAGVQTIIATDTTTGSITGTQAGITVNAAATSTFQVSAPAAAVTGTAFNVTVTAKDAFGNTATGYTGTVHFTSSDGQAVLPTDYTFTGGDAGSHTFSVTLNTAGSQTVTATDTVTGSITGSDAVTVSSSAATHFEVSAPPTATAGASFTVTVTALNSSNAIDTGYRGTVHFTSSDGQAILPANYTFTAGDAGSHTFTITLGTAGSQTVTATDTTTGSITGSDTIAASAGAATQFTVSAPSNATEGIAFNATVTAKDAFGNTATGYTGTVHFTSSDGQAILPANYTFTAGDAGSHTFTITLNTTGNQTITATDTVTGSITGNDIVAVGVLPPPPPTAQPFAVGTAKGPVASVTMYNPDRTVAFTVQPFGPNYRNGVRIAVGDVTGDGVPDVVAVTNGGIKAKARIIDGSTGTVLPTELLGATPYKGKVSVAAGDVDGDGTADIALGLNSGGPRARLFKGGDFTKLTGLLAGPTAGFVGNTTVALGDMTGDGKADLVVSSLYSTGSRVAGFNGESLVPGETRQRLFTRLMLGGPYVSGLFLTVGDVNGDTRADLVIGSPGTRNPNVKVFSGKALVDDNARTKIATFTPGGSTKGGVRVAVRDINGDGTVDIITSSGEMVSAFQGGAGLPAIGLPPLMFTFDPNPAFIGSVWVG